MADKMSEEKISLLRAYGADVVVCPTAVPPEHPASYYSVADRLTRETPGAFRPDQYSNPANPAEHERSTGPEIWRQTEGRVTHFVAGVGTGGTITGVAHALKAQNPAVQIVAADPAGSVYSGGSGRPYLVEGVGEDFWPTTYDPSVVDRIVEVSDAESFAAARRVTREEGLLIGGSCGTAVHAALVVGAELGPDAVVVVLLPDSGRNYLSKIFDDGWMTRYGFLRHEGPTAGDVIAAKDGAIPDLVRDHRRHADARRVRAHARARRVAARRRHHHRVAARGVGGVGRGVGAAAHGQGVPRSRRARGARRRDHGTGAADARDRGVGRPTSSTGWSRAPRCSCSTAVILWVCSPAPTCSRSWPNAHPRDAQRGPHG